MARVVFDFLQPTTRLIDMERCFASLLAKDNSKQPRWQVSWKHAPRGVSFQLAIQPFNQLFAKIQIQQIVVHGVIILVRFFGISIVNELGRVIVD